MWHEERPEGVPEGPTVAKLPEQGAKEGCGTALKAPRRAHTDQVPQQQPEVAAGDVHEQPFPDVRMPSKMDPSHPARLAHVRERPLQQLPATPQEPMAPLPADPAPVGIHGVASRLPLLPAPAPPVRLRDVATPAP